MSANDIVTITLNIASPGVTREGYGIPLVAGCSMTGWGSTRVRSYSPDPSEWVADFGVYTPEYKALTAIFSQAYQPEIAMVGRRALPPTQRFDIAIAAVRNSHVYEIDIIHPNGTAETASFTSDASALNDEIVTGLVAAVNGLTGSAYHTATAVGVALSTTVQIVSNTAGEWLDVRVNIDDLNIEQNHADPGLATDLAAIANEDSSWFAFVNPWNSTAEGAVATTFAEANSKYFAAGTVHSEVPTVVSASATDAPELAKDGSYRFTNYMYSPHMSEFAEAARLGRFLPEKPGSAVWLNKPLVGCTAPVLTETHRTNMKAKNCDWVETIQGLTIVRGDGQVASGAFIDDVIGLEWFQSEARADILDMQIAAGKIPYTDAGIESIAAVLRGVCQRAVAQGVFASSPAPAVSVPKASTVSSGDRGTRTLNGVQVSAYLAGAVQKVNVIVNVA